VAFEQAQRAVGVATLERGQGALLLGEDLGGYVPCASVAGGVHLSKHAVTQLADG
jgi:hypothetical protein